MTTSLNSKPISEIHEQYTLNNVDLQPRYQRRLVWPFQNKVYLIDSILQGLPLPKFFLRMRIDSLTGKTLYEMVDGQQRLATIFEFIRGMTSDNKPFVLSRKSHPKQDSFLSELEGHTFSTLPQELQQRFWLYKLSMEELTSATEEEIKDMFVRLNLSNVKLNSQELRNATFQGDFKKMVYGLAEEFADEYYLKYKILSVSNIKRMLDAEFTSELVAAMMRGITNKKDRLDEIYNDYDQMDQDEVARTEKAFRAIFQLVESIMGDDLFATRFKNKTDFYSLFYMLYSIVYKQKLKIDGSVHSKIRSVLVELSVEATDTASNPQVLKYFVSAVNSGDSEANRTYRHQYLLELIKPLCTARDPKRLFSDSEKQFLWHRSPKKSCGVCKKIIKSYSDCEIDHIVPWSSGGRTDLSNGQITHARCNRIKSSKPK